MQKSTDTAEQTVSLEERHHNLKVILGPVKLTISLSYFLVKVPKPVEKTQTPLLLVRPCLPNEQLKTLKTSKKKRTLFTFSDHVADLMLELGGAPPAAAGADGTEFDAADSKPKRPRRSQTSKDSSSFLFPEWGEFRFLLANADSHESNGVKYPLLSY